MSAVRREADSAAPSLLALKGVGKDYAKVESRGGQVRLVWDLLRGHGAANVFRALDDVGFTLERGQSLGIVGENGAGKSTLLKVVAGVIAPTRGRVEVNGRVGALHDPVADRVERTDGRFMACCDQFTFEHMLVCAGPGDIVAAGHRLVHGHQLNLRTELLREAKRDRKGRFGERRTIKCNQNCLHRILAERGERVEGPQRRRRAASRRPLVVSDRAMIRP